MTPREILDEIKRNYSEYQSLLDKAEKAGIRGIADDLSGGWIYYDAAIESAAKKVNLDQEIE